MASHINSPDGAEYWFATAGQDLARMMRLAGTPEPTQAGFLEFFRDVLCPALGGKPDGTPTQKGSVVGWDGSPFEYSFEFKGSTRAPDVRFVADVTPHRPVDAQRPLSTANARAIIDCLARRTPGFDSTWDRALARCFDCEHLPADEQQALIDKLGFVTPMILGFDIKPRMMMLEEQASAAAGHHRQGGSSVVPVMLKSYYAPHYAVSHQSLPGGNWEAIVASVRQLPELETSPNVLRTLETLEAYVADKPAYRAAARFVATGFVAPGRGGARLKIYMRYQGDSFDDIWDYYTLGGRIPDLDADRQPLRDLIELARGGRGGRRDDQGQGEGDGDGDGGDPVRRAKILTKPVAFYFSLTPDRPHPTSKVYYPPARGAANDLVVARGITEWLNKYGWNDGGIRVEDWVQTVFPHRKLEDKNGIFTFVTFGWKEGGSKMGSSLGIYMTPELYETPRL